MELNDVKKEAISILFKKLFKRTHFDITYVRELSELSGNHLHSEVFETMRAFHCINYGDISENTREWLFQEVLSLVTNKGFNFAEFEVCDPVIKSKTLKYEKV
jgi:hypothetical protein